MKASKTSKGVHDKKEAPTHRVADLSGVRIIRFCVLRKTHSYMRYVNAGSRQVEAVFAILATSWSF
jgi:hypothetical protein